jgi:hypothetical protein
MKISYINFWPQNYDIDFWLSNFCKSIFKDNIELVHFSKNPDILFCSCFGPIRNIQKTIAKIKIFFTGENVDRGAYNEYSNEKIMKETFNLRLAFHFNDIKNNKLKLPLWLTYYNFFTMNTTENFMTYMINQRHKNIQNKIYLGSLVCRHDRGRQRMKIMNELIKHGRVVSAGKFNNNCGRIIGPTWNDKLNFLKQSIFNICPENSSRLGYCTEKLFHAFEAGCIPLYWGNDVPEKDLIEKNSYIFVNMENEAIRKQQIANAVNHQKEIIQNPIFTKQAPYVLDNYYKTLEWQLKVKLGLIEKQKIYGISYASRTFNARQQKATAFKNSGYFDDFKMYNENDISNKFKENNKEIWYNSKRGGGWWIWKPYIIYEKLKAMMDNDVLIYFDAGCDLCTTIEAKKRFNQYIEMVNNHWAGHLRFLLTHQEKKYTNQYTINYFEKRYNTKMDKYISNEQLMATVHIIRKTKFTMDFFKEVLSILEDNKHLFDETYTQKGENHRWDQSIMSLLYKLKGGNLIIKDECWFGRGGCLGNESFGSNLSKKYPIWATRFTN